VPLISKQVSTHTRNKHKIDNFHHKFIDIKFNQRHKQQEKHVFNFSMFLFIGEKIIEYDKTKNLKNGAYSTKRIFADKQDIVYLQDHTIQMIY